MHKYEAFLILLVGVRIFLTVLFLGSWAGNIVRLAHCDFQAPFRAEVFYAVGVVSPTCMVTAFLDLEPKSSSEVHP